MSTITKGMKFKNAGMELKLLDFYETADTNVALLLCLTDGLYITVKNLQTWNGSFVWDWGHYMSKKQDALIDYEKRKNEM